MKRFLVSLSLLQSLSHYLSVSLGVSHSSLCHFHARLAFGGRVARAPSPVVGRRQMPGIGCRRPAPFVLSGGRPDFTEKWNDVSAFSSFSPPCPWSGERVTRRGEGHRSPTCASRPSPGDPSPRRHGQHRGPIAPSHTRARPAVSSFSSSSCRPRVVLAAALWLQK